MAPRPSIFLFYGNDRPLLYKKFVELQHSLNKSVADLQLVSFDETSMSEIQDFIESGSLFGTTFCIRVTKIKGATSFDFWEGSPHYLLICSAEESDPYSKTNLPYLQKNPCSIPKPWEFSKILYRTFGQSITPDGIEYLSSNLSSVLDIEELQKQKAFYNIPVLNLENIASILPDERTNDFLLVEYFFDPKKTLLFFHTFRRIYNQTSSLEGFWNILFRKTQDFIRIKKGLLDKWNLSVLSKETKIPSFILEKQIPIVKSYSLQQLEYLAQKILEGQYLSRYYTSKMDRILVTRLYFEKSLAIV